MKCIAFLIEMKYKINLQYPIYFHLQHIIRIILIGVICLCFHTAHLLAQDNNSETHSIQVANEIQYATEVAFGHPSGMTFDALGNMYFADGVTQKIYKIDTNGILTTIAGTDISGFNGEGILATEAQFNLPINLKFDELGNLFIADFYNYRLRKIDSLGIITTIAGNNTGVFLVNGGPAVDTNIGEPASLDFDKNGNIFISSLNASSILKLDSNGNIHMFAGQGFGGYSGDGGPALKAKLNLTSDIEFDRYGNLFIADSGNHRIRKIDQNGFITTVAGNGDNDFSGDGGPAIQAKIFYPRGIVLDKDGNLYVADQENHRIRKVDTNGIITTIAGSGKPGPNNGGFSGDGGLAIQAELKLPIELAMDQEENLYIADRGNHRIRKVDTNGIISTVVGNGNVPPLIQNILNNALLNASSESQFPWYQQQFVILLLVVNGLIIALAVFYYLHLRHTVAKSKNELLQEKEARQLVEKEMQHISERERNRIGQDLHDSVIQQLTGVKMMGEAILKDQQSNTILDSQYVERLNELLM